MLNITERDVETLGIKHIATDNTGRILELNGVLPKSRLRSIISWSMVEAYDYDLKLLWAREFGLSYMGGFK